jgi:hypothetical protein
MRRILVAALGVLLMLFAGWILTTSSLFKTCKANETAAKSEQAKENAPPIELSLADNTAINTRCAGQVVFEYRVAATARPQRGFG